MFSSSCHNFLDIIVWNEAKGVRGAHSVVAGLITTFKGAWCFDSLVSFIPITKCICCVWLNTAVRLYQIKQRQLTHAWNNFIGKKMNLWSNLFCYVGGYKEGLLQWHRKNIVVCILFQAYLWKNFSSRNSWKRFLG